MRVFDNGFGIKKKIGSERKCGEELRGKRGKGVV